MRLSIFTVRAISSSCLKRNKHSSPDGDIHFREIVPRTWHYLFFVFCREGLRMMVICRRHKGVLGGRLDSTYFLFMCRGWRCGGRRTRVPRPPHESYDGRGTRVWRPLACRRKGRMQSCASRNVGMYRMECGDVQDGMQECAGPEKKRSGAEIRVNNCFQLSACVRIRQYRRG